MQEIFNVVAAAQTGDVLLLPAVKVSWAAAHVADARRGVERPLELVGGCKLAANAA